MAAWTLPNDGKLTPTQRREAMTNFSQYIGRVGLSYKDVERMVGSPRATNIRDLCRGTFTGNSDQHIRTLNMWVEQDARQRTVALGDDFVETRVAKQVLGVARLVRENKTMGLVWGPTGIGKSRCARALYETYSGAILITAMFGNTNPRGLCHAMADIVGVRSARVMRGQQKYQTQLERLIARLRDSSRLVIIDDAHKLNAEAIEFLREIHDATGVPVLLLATKILHERILEDIDPDGGQLYSRFDITHPLTEGRDVTSGGKKLFTIEEIKKLYHQVPIRLAPDAAAYLRDVANFLGRGSLRSCKVLVRNAARRARKRQSKGDEETVTISADDLHYAETRLKRSPGDSLQIDERRRIASRNTA